MVPSRNPGAEDGETNGQVPYEQFPYDQFPYDQFPYDQAPLG